MADSRQSGSTLLLDEYFSAGDDRFVDELRAVASPRKLAGLVDRWKRDPRPWSRGQVLAYLERPLDRPGHEVVVKRLFKHYESAGDTEVMAAFLLALDRLVRRVRRTSVDYDHRTRQVTQRQILFTPRNSIPRQESKTWQDPKTLQPVTGVQRTRRGARLFTYRTRYYLRRRAWRYFRRLGHQRPLDYADAVAGFLKLHTDEFLGSGENLLDSWGLMNACFRGSPVLRFSAHRVALNAGRSLAELAPAPRFPSLWQREPAMATLIGLICDARSRAVRAWAMQLLRAAHGERLAGITPGQLVRMLDCPDGEVQQFAAELLGSMPHLETLPLATWLTLLGTTHPTALATVCDAMVRHVRPDRLTLEQCVELACKAPVQVARLGLGFLRDRRVATEADRGLIARLSAAQCGAVAAELAEWALGVVGSAGSYDREAVCGFFDALLAETRQGAWRWLSGSVPGSPPKGGAAIDRSAESPAWDDPQLWVRLLETPFDDLKARLIEALDRRAKRPGAQAGASDGLAALWCATLLNVHRGGRQKRRAAHQVADAIRRRPEQADRLLPVLAVAVRSIRAPEQRAGLSAVVGLIESAPALAGKVRAVLPELELPAIDA